jgi:predicted dehydrogenase
VLRFFPEFVAARKQVNAGAVGEVTSVRTRRGGQFPRAWQDWYGKVDWSGGAILDLVIHDLDWLRWTFGEVERVFAKGTAASLGEGAVVDLDYSLITLRFTSGAMAHVEATWADPGGFKVSFEICGDEGMLEYNFNEPAAPPLIVAKQAVSGMGAGVPVPESPLAVSPYQQELAHFLHCLDTGATPTVTPQDGIEAVRIANAAIESCRTGKVITLNSGTEAKS